LSIIIIADKIVQKSGKNNDLCLLMKNVLLHECRDARLMEGSLPFSAPGLVVTGAGK
jgi:hypothetical protein